MLSESDIKMRQEEMEKLKLYIIRGLPRSGKATLAKELTSYAIAADDYPGVYDEKGFHADLVPDAIYMV